MSSPVEGETNPGRVIWSRRIGYVLGLAALIVMSAYVIRRRDVVATLRHVRPGHLVGLASVSLAVSVANGLRFAAAVRVYGLRLTFSAWYGMSVVNTMLNYALPAQGGTAMKGAYMKRRYGFSYTDFTALTASSELLALATAGLLGVISWALVPGIDEAGSSAVLGLLVATILAAVGGVVVLAQPSVLSWMKGKWGRRLARFSDGVRAWASRRVLAGAYAGWTVVWLVLQGLRLGIAFAAVGVAVDPVSLLLIQSLVAISGAVSTIPGNLGLREGVASLSAGLLGLDADLALLASLVDRAVSLVFVIVIGLIYTRVLARQPEPDEADVA